MRVPLYFISVALMMVLVQCSDSNTNNNYLEPLNVAADSETISYLLPKLAAKYRPSNEWSGVTDPRFYLLTEMDSNEAAENPMVENGKLDARRKRAGRIGDSGASLSIVNSLDVLRNRLLLEIARKKAKEGISRNRQLLMNLGKRAYLHYDNKL